MPKVVAMLENGPRGNVTLVWDDGRVAEWYDGRAAWVAVPSWSADYAKLFSGPGFEATGTIERAPWHQPEPVQPEPNPAAWMHGVTIDPPTR